MAIQDILREKFINYLLDFNSGDTTLSVEKTDDVVTIYKTTYDPRTGAAQSPVSVGSMQVDDIVIQYNATLEKAAGLTEALTKVQGESFTPEKLVKRVDVQNIFPATLGVGGYRAWAEIKKSQDPIVIFWVDQMQLA